jgi:hypothetical protein
MTARLLLTLGLFAAAVPLRAQGDAAALTALAGRYVEDYQQQLSTILCEERQSQRIIKKDGTIGRRRELVAEMALVRSGTQTLLFRDVISVDGEPVRNREERLRRLFLEPARDSLAKASLINRESGRYNLGVTAILDGLMLPLKILSPAEAGRFRFNLTEQGLGFDEQSPTMIKAGLPTSMHDLPLHGWLTVEAGTGRLRAATLTASDNRRDWRIDVRYDEHADLKMLVPSAMQQRYQFNAKLTGQVLEVSSTYSNFRRFEVAAKVR